MKLQFIGMRGSGLRRLKPFLKEGFKNPKNFQNTLANNVFLKVSGILKGLFQKSLKWGAGATPLPDKPKFEYHQKEPPHGRFFFCDTAHALAVFFLS